MLETYPDFLAGLLREWKPTKIVNLGDTIDYHCISYHATEPESPNGNQEVADARKQVQILYKLFKGYDVAWILGNHDSLPNRRVAEIAGWPKGMVREDTDFWEVPKWKCYPRYTRHIIDGVRYAHGDGGMGGKNPALRWAEANCCSFVLGHFHSSFGVNYAAGETFRVAGMNVGCGIDHSAYQFRYSRHSPRKPIIGAGIVLEGKYFIPEPMIL